MDVTGELDRGDALTGSSCWGGADPAARSRDEPPELALVVDADAVLLPPSGSECRGGSDPADTLLGTSGPGAGGGRRRGDARVCAIAS